MPTVSTTYFRQQLSTGNINLSGDTFFVSLMNNYVNSSSINSLKSVSAWNQISAFEVSGNGYSSSALSNKTVSASTDGTIIQWDASDLTWSNVTISPWGLSIRKNNNVVVGFIDFGSEQDAINGNLTVQFNTLGIGNII